ncbi:MAG TPA: dihydrofolate reductase [Prolixibacteraceae bacterium]|jgi:dipeptidyl-peptidase-3|nr:dihydrofolate reductase [Prolixibacteraceae bacterium]
MNVFAEKFADLKILRYAVPGFEALDLNKKLYIYHLSQAALCGRDILWDQNNRYNLSIRAVLETIWKTFKGNRETESFKSFEIYLKRVWFSNGIHHHYSTEKLPVGFTETYFSELVAKSRWRAFKQPSGTKFEKFIASIQDVIFNPEKEVKRVNLDPDKDLLDASCNNYYKDVTQEEAETFYAALKTSAGFEPISFGLNSTLVKENNQMVEKVWKLEGKYGKAIQQIIFWLNKAVQYAENDLQKKYIGTLIQYYTSGDLALFDQYSIDWVKELEGEVDFMNGFIEVYGDPLGIKGSWESIVNFKDLEATKRASILSENAQWFEDHSPVDPQFKKDAVKGVSAKVINVAMLAGDCYPATPIGINLPNAEWIREKHGSKSVTIENITQAYFLDSMNNGMLEEFAGSSEEIERVRQYGYLAGNLHTDLHECLGHGSGKVRTGVSTENLKNYYSTIEETRADLFALYYMLDDQMLHLGLLPSMDAAKAEYDTYLRNGLLTQLTRIEPGKDIEESHMRNRQLISRWVYEAGKENNVVEFIRSEDKTYIRINNYPALRELFGQLLKEIQRVKSEGDFEAAKQLVEDFGVKVDRPLHDEILVRFKKLDLAPYAGFLNPVYELKTWPCGTVADVLVTYDEEYSTQMLRYSKDYGFLPMVND